MRIGFDDRIWVVTDPNQHSVFIDIFQETTLRSLALQFKGGLSMDSNPTIYTKPCEAKADAKNRMSIMRGAS